jgi:hypothetical protein
MNEASQGMCSDKKPNYVRKKILFRQTLGECSSCEHELHT